MSINEIAIRTPLAVVANGEHIRLYQLTVDGSVRESQWEGSWGGGQAANTVGKVRLNSPLAATNVSFGQIRVYGIDNDDTIKELAYDAGKGWHQGGIDGKFKVAPYSSVATTFVGVLPHVYAQLPDNTIQEFRWSGYGWHEGDNLGEALPGTSITATSWGGGEDTASIR